MSKGNRLDAWNVLYVTKVNVRYWKSLIEVYKERVRRIEYSVAGIGLIAAIIVGVAKRDWVSTVVPAVSGFLIAVIGGPLVRRWATSEAKWGHSSWSQLCSDAELLWRHGEEHGWEDSDMTARTATLVEREKQYQAREYHNENPLVLQDSEARVHSDLTNAYRTEEY